VFLGSPYVPKDCIPLTVRTDAHADGFDLRAVAESRGAKTITEQTKDVRNLLPSKLELLWDWALEPPKRSTEN
jgi:hypothetical protein